MGFLVNRSAAEAMEGTEPVGGQTRLQSLLICAGLLYLAVPNLLFLWGWFTPIVAVAATAVMLFALLRAATVSFCGLQPAPANPASLRGSLGLLLALALACLLLLFYILRLGVLGFVPSFIDHYVLRHAMFSNLSEAAWPLVLPNGKEMSYYLAGVLPSALLARVFPAMGQWAVVLWTTLGALLAMLLFCSRLVSPRRSWAASLALVALFLAVVCHPLATYNLGPRVLGMLNSYADANLTAYCPAHRLSCSNPLNNCGILYHIFPSAFLVAAMMMVCRRRAELVLAVAMALLVPISPFAGIGLLPLFFARWVSAIRAHGLSWLSLLADMLFPAMMAFVVVIYFTRADGSSSIALAGQAWGWPEFVSYELWLLAGWLVLMLPLFCVLRRDAFFYTLCACCVLLPLFFIGTMSAPGAAGHNELLLKAYPAYLALLAMYWLQAWEKLGWCKYLYLTFCALTFIAQLIIFSALFCKGTNAYMEVDDRWNGHLNHGDSFLNQSIPPCNAPLVPGVLLREAGASEKTFPGCLLPKAPGCDYSRPAAGEQEHASAPL